MKTASAPLQGLPGHARAQERPGSALAASGWDRRRGAPYQARLRAGSVSHRRGDRRLPCRTRSAGRPIGRGRTANPAPVPPVNCAARQLCRPSTLQQCLPIKPSTNHGRRRRSRSGPMTAQAAGGGMAQHQHHRRQPHHARPRGSRRRAIGHRHARPSPGRRPPAASESSTTIRRWSRRRAHRPRLLISTQN